MRVLFEGGALHVAMTAGRFAVRGSDYDSIEWLTEYAPLVQHAGSLDEEVLVPGRSVPEGASDALALPDGRLAVLHADRVDVLDATGAVEMSASLEGDGTHVPGIEPKEEWQNEKRFAGYKRGLRLFPAPGGFLITANESGHVARFSLQDKRIVRVLRVPGAAENTVYATCIGDDVLVGMKWNGRHSELFLVSPSDELVTHWPEGGDPRWGIPGAVLLGDADKQYVVTYSDDGPNARKLALLSLPNLEEIDHAEIKAWPNDLATDGKHFAAVANDLLVIGHVERNRIVIDVEWSSRDIMTRAGVKAPALPTTATNDGRGSRVWVKGKIETLVVDGSRPVIGMDGGVFDLEGGERKTILVPMNRRLHDVGGDRLVVMEGGLFRLLTGPKHTERMRAQPAGEHGGSAWLFEDGMLHVDRNQGDHDEDEFVLTWCPGSGSPKELARCLRSFGEFVFARGPSDVAWYELQREDSQEEHYLVRWSPKAKGASDLIDLPITGLAYDGATLYVKTERYSQARIHRVGADGALEQITNKDLPFASRGLAVGGGRAFFIATAPVGASDESNSAPHVSQLFALDLVTGVHSSIATASIGELSAITIAGGRVWWLETTTNHQVFLGAGQEGGMSAVCSVEL